MKAAGCASAYTPSNDEITLKYSGSESGDLLCDGMDPDRVIAGEKILDTSTDKEDCISKCVAYSGTYGCFNGCTSATLQSG